MEAGNSKATMYSCKGIVADNEIYITGGIINIFSNDDGIHANNNETIANAAVKASGDIRISSGVINVATEDDGIHADNNLEINGGSIKIASSYEGIEAEYINITAGDIVVFSSDDGINSFVDDESAKINISGGSIYISVVGFDVDGIDSNGTYTQTGGVIAIKCNSSLDTDSIATISKGTIIGVGYSISSASKLPSKLLSGSFSAGTYSIISNDKAIINFSLGEDVSKLYLYSSYLETSKSYTLKYENEIIESWTQ